jgi:hypothetical protein
VVHGRESFRFRIGVTVRRTRPTHTGNVALTRVVGRIQAGKPVCSVRVYRSRRIRIVDIDPGKPHDVSIAPQRESNEPYKLCETWQERVGEQGGPPLFFRWWQLA